MMEVALKGAGYEANDGGYRLGLDSSHISVSAVLSYTGERFFPLLSVYASCSCSIMYNIHFAFIH